MKKIPRILITTATMLMLAAAPFASYASDSQEAAAESADGSVSQLLRLVNEERSQAGIPALTLNHDVSLAAQTRAVELESEFSHTRPGGDIFATAITDTGVSFQGAGENIAYGYETPEQVIQVWMNSSPHRASILNGDYTSIGIAYHISEDDVPYWTQIFIY